jgi:hypothetical protein
MQRMRPWLQCNLSQVGTVVAVKVENTTALVDRYLDDVTAGVRDDERAERERAAAR